MITGLLIRFVYLIAGALVGGIAGAVASDALRRFRNVRITVLPEDPGHDQFEDAPLYRGHRPVHEQHPERKTPNA